MHNKVLLSLSFCSFTLLVGNIPLITKEDFSGESRQHAIDFATKQITGQVTLFSNNFYWDLARKDLENHFGINNDPSAKQKNFTRTYQILTNLYNISQTANATAPFWLSFQQEQSEENRFKLADRTFLLFFETESNRIITDKENLGKSNGLSAKKVRWRRLYALFNELLKKDEKRKEQ